jgi:hypothetical protein
LEEKETTPLNPMRGHYDTPSIDDEKDHLSHLFPEKLFFFHLYSTLTTTNNKKEKRDHPLRDVISRTVAGYRYCWLYGRYYYIRPYMLFISFTHN